MRITSLILFVLTVALVGSAGAQSMKVGFMNPDEILEQLPEKDDVERELDAFLDEKEQEFQEEAIEYQNLLGEYQERAENMSQSQNQQYQQRLQQKEQQLQQLQQQMEQQFEQRRQELIQPLLERMNTHIQALAEEKNLDYVINEATGMGDMIVLHASSESRAEYELTDEVLQRMLNNN